MVRAADLPERIQAALREGLGLPSLHVAEIRATPAFACSQRAGEDVEAVAPLDVVVTDAPGARERVLAVVIKVAPDAREAEVHRRFGDRDETRRFLPACYGADVADDTLLVIERVEHALLLGAGDDVSGWHPPMRWRVVEALAQLHAVGLGQTLDARWPAGSPGAEGAVTAAPAFRAAIDAGRRGMPRVVTPPVHATAMALVDTIGEWIRPLDALPRTLVCGDCTPWSVGFRPDRTAVLVDWSHAAWDVPQRDIADLLVSTLRPGYEQAALWEPVERLRLALGRAAGVELDGEAWREGFRIQLRLGLLARVAPLWAGAATPYVERVTAVATEVLRRT